MYFAEALRQPAAITLHTGRPPLVFYLSTTAESERNAPTATSAGERGSQAWFRSHLMKVDTSPKPPCLFAVAAAAAPVTPVAVEINVDAGAQRLAKHFQVAAQRGSGDPLQTRGPG